MESIINQIVFWYLRKLYKKYGEHILFIKGTEKDFPKYLLYTENESVRLEMIKLWKKL